MLDTKDPLKVSICNAHNDKSKAREIYRYLKKRGILSWLSEEDVLPGQKWEEEISKALDSADAIIVCLSKNSVGKEGDLQTQIRFALKKALRIPTGRIFLIPARLEDCEVPYELKEYQWVDLFDPKGYPRLMKSLKERASQLERATVQVLKQDDNSLSTAEKPKRKSRDGISVYVNGSVDGTIIIGSKNTVQTPPSYPDPQDNDLDEIQSIVDRLNKLLQKVPEKDQKNVLDKLVKVLNSQDSAATLAALFPLLRTNPEASDLLYKITKFIVDKDGKTAIDEISSISPALLLSSKRLMDISDFRVNGALYSPEKYPFESRFDNIGRRTNRSEQDDTLQTWLHNVGLETSPFLDAQSPYITENQIDLRDMFVGLFQNQYKPRQNKLLFQNDWDLHAGLYDYCRGLSKEEETFFAMLPPANWHDYESADPKEIILHALANEWLYTLALDDYSFFEFNPTWRQALYRLMIWHCGTVWVLKMTIEKINRDYGKTTYKKIENLLEVISQMSLKEDVGMENLRPAEINALAGLRPARTFRTRILCPSINLDDELIPSISTQKIINRLDTIASWLKTLHTDIIYFIFDASQSGVNLSEENLVKLCNNRLMACSDKTINGFDQLFLPHVNDPAELILARKAHGSPGEMIRLGQTLLLNHCRNHPDKEYLDIQELLDLKA